MLDIPFTKIVLMITILTGSTAYSKVSNIDIGYYKILHKHRSHHVTYVQLTILL